MIIGFAVATTAQWLIKPAPRDLVIDHLLLAAFSLPAFAVGAVSSRLYLARANTRSMEEARRVVRTTTIGIAFIIVVAVAAKYDQVSRLWLSLSGLSIVALVLVERRIARHMFARLRREKVLSRRIIIIGTDSTAHRLVHSYLNDSTLGYEVVGFVGAPTDVKTAVPVLGSLDDLDAILRDNEITGAVISVSGISPDAVNTLTRDLTDRRYHVTLSSSLYDIDLARLRYQQLDGQTLTYVERVVRGGWRATAKRTLDIVGAASILVLTAPILLVSAVAVKLNSRGPVLFKQVRVGRFGTPITIYKLRTMTFGSEERLAELRSLNEVDGPIFKLRHDPRVTRVGAFLRKTSIDELPQLWCVLRGTMSIVGPRPMLPSEAVEMDPHVVSERVRVLPGLTGLWQVSGRSDASFENYCRLDQYYVDNWTLGHDVRICLRTVGVVLFGKGAR